MSTRRFETALERGLAALPGVRGLDEQRATRVIEFCLVGGLGAVIDLAVTISLLQSTHYVVANGLGFLVAVTTNFAGNWWLTFDRPDGSLPWQYGSYVGLHSATFAVRIAVIGAILAVSPVPAAVASVLGVIAAAVANYLGTEAIFDGDGELWLDAVGAVNHLAHTIYTSRLRSLLLATGLYGPLYRTYQWLIALLYRDDVHTLACGPATARVYTEHAPEIVSVFHTVEKERPIMRRFMGELRAEDTVWDVGANLGVYAVLASDRADEVVAFEPVPQTAERCRANLALSGAPYAAVLAVALAESDGTAQLALERDELATQTPRLDGGGVETMRVPVCRGDSLDYVKPPTILKVDVEGAELDVLRGLGARLDGVRLAYVETHDGQVHEGESAAVAEYLREQGFVVEEIGAGQQTYYRAVRADG